MATLLAVVSDHPAPMVHAGPLQPVLTAMLARDPQHRPTPGQARIALTGVLQGPAAPFPAAPAPTAAASAAAPPPAAAPHPRPVDAGIQVQRFDAADLRRRAHDAKVRLRALSEQLSAPPPRRAPAPARPRPRFKRRWVVVPTLVLLLLVVALISGALWLVAEGGQLFAG